MSNKQEYVIHSPEEICEIRKVATATATVREKLRKMIMHGMTTAEIDKLAHQLIMQVGGVSAFYGYRNYPGQICISINDEVVHGIGSPHRIISNGDLISLDIGVNLNGFIGDSAISFVLGGEMPKHARFLLEKTHQALMRGIEAARAGNRIRHISTAVERVGKEAKLGIVREYVGHGVGVQLHEPPEIPNFVSNNSGPQLKNGMVLAIEPMFTLGTHQVKIDKDNWTVRTLDAKLSAHFEHMVLINDDKPEVLTWPRMM
jgi:methionyl aminopeptidase